jgi:hypothetical protein
MMMQFALVSRSRLAVAGLLAISLAALFLFVACGDDDEEATTSPTQTQTASVSVTPDIGACEMSNLEAELVSSEGTAGHRFVTFNVRNSQDACSLVGPPNIVWYDDGANEVEIPFEANLGCESGSTDYSTCVLNEQIDLPAAGQSVAAGSPYGALVVVSVGNIGALEPCTDGSVLAEAVGFEFGEEPSIQVELPEDIELQSCSPQVTLHGYGPLIGGN